MRQLRIPESSQKPGMEYPGIYVVHVYALVTERAHTSRNASIKVKKTKTIEEVQIFTS